MSLWGTITSAVLAKADITIETQPTAGKIVRIGDGTVLTYQWVASAPGATSGGIVQVLIGTDVDDSANNLAGAISDGGVGTGIEGTDFGTGTTAHAEVTATLSTNTVTVTAVPIGRLGNLVRLFSNDFNTSISGPSLQGGIDADEGKPKNLTTEEKSRVYASDGGWTHRVPISTSAYQDLPVVTIPGNTETVVIGAKTYTFQTTLTDTDGNVQIVSGDVGATVENLVRAINLTGTPGTDYATSMTKNTDVTAVKSTDNVLRITAIQSGTEGNDLTLSSTITDGWTQVALEHGQDFRGSSARGELTFSSIPTNGNTVSIDEKNGVAKVYTFQDTLTDVDGNVHIGANATDTLNNLINAINLGAGAGTDYATSMTLHNMAKASKSNKVGDIMNIDAKENGDHVNQLDLADNNANMAWTNATFTGGFSEREVLVDIGELATTLGVVNVTSITITNVPSDSQFAIADLDKIRVRVAYNEKVVYNGAGSPTVGLTISGNDPAQSVTAGIVSPANTALPYVEFEYVVGAEGVHATGTHTIGTNPNNNDNVTINAVVYTFKTTLTPANGEVLIGATNNDSANNLRDAINGVVANADVTYGAGASSPHGTVTSSASTNVVTHTAVNGGTGPNAFNLLESTATVRITVSGATMASGTNGIQADAGELTLNGTTITLGGGAIFEADNAGVATAQAVPNDFTAGGADGATNIVTPFNASVAEVLIN